MKKLLPLVFLAIALPTQGQEFKPRRVVRAFDPITKPNIATIDTASDWVKDKELVLGVVIGKEARAYPINQLTRPTREIINDHLGGQAIAATW